MNAVKKLALERPDCNCDKCGSCLARIVVKSREASSVAVDCMVSLQAVRACIEYIANAVDSRPDDSLRKICNEAVQRNGIPLIVANDYEYDTDNQYIVSVEDRQNS